MNIWKSKGFSGRLIFIWLFSLQLFLGACHATYYKIPVTKSRKHFSPYDAKKDKGKRRVKTKKYKSLKKTKGIRDE